MPGRAQEFLERWELQTTGPGMHGVTALVLPVQRADGAAAALKLQLLDEESAGEPVALRAWAGDGSVRLLEHDGDTGTLLLERLDERRHLSALAERDSRAAVQVLAELLARLTAVPAPAGLRGLGDVAAGMLDEVPQALEQLADVRARRLLRDCAAAVAEVAVEPGDRLLHWDLHYDNVLAGGREPWLAIDPKPLSGDPGFDLLPHDQQQLPCGRGAVAVRPADGGRGAGPRTGAGVDAGAGAAELPVGRGGRGGRDAGGTAPGGGAVARAVSGRRGQLPWVVGPRAREGPGRERLGCGHDP